MPHVSYGQLKYYTEYLGMKVKPLTDGRMKKNNLITFYIHYYGYLISMELYVRVGYNIKHD